MKRKLQQNIEKRKKVNSKFKANKDKMRDQKNKQPALGWSYCGQHSNMPSQNLNMWDDIQQQSQRSAQFERDMQNNMWLYNSLFDSFDEDDEGIYCLDTGLFEDKLDGIIKDLQNIEEAFWLEYDHQVLNTN